MKVIFPFILLTAITLSANAQVSLRDCFKAMPDSIVPYLSENNRLDMLDFIDSNMKAEVTNALDGRSQMTALTNDSITLRLSEALTAHLLLVTLAEPTDSATQGLAWITTHSVSGGGEETSVSYFTPSWQPLPKNLPLDEGSSAAVKAFLTPSSLLKADNLVK